MLVSSTVELISQFIPLNGEDFEDFAIRFRSSPNDAKTTFLIVLVHACTSHISDHYKLFMQTDFWAMLGYTCTLINQKTI